MALIDKNSHKEVIGCWLVSLGICISLLLFVPAFFISLPLIAVIVWFCGFVTNFFRVPVRKRAGSSTEITAVADGEIVIIEKAFEKEFLKEECIQISIYMDFFDVHANFWPVDGEVTYSKYHPGKHWLAFLPKASDDNEHHCTCIRTDSGNNVFFKQIAGTFARRIVCYSREGDKVESGEQCGIIKFGSRIDIFLPVDSEILVNLNDKVKACETVIARTL